MPPKFREKDCQALDALLKKQLSAVLIGMKRVGITGFLRYFVAEKKQKKQFFVYLDLNDLVERELLPFWILLLTRLVDNVQKSSLSEPLKRRCRHLFIQSIQLKDHYFTLEAIRKILKEVVAAKLLPIIIVNHFDRLIKNLTPEFLNNLSSLRLPYILTSFRELPRLNQALFCHNLYIKPAGRKDADFILKELGCRRNPDFLLNLCGGYAQYLQLAIIALNRNPKVDLLKDEAINFQSEELYSSLTKAEKQALLTKNYAAAPYLKQAGMVNRKNQLFSPLFTAYLKSLPKKPIHKTELTQKETLLFNLLNRRKNEICDREMIIRAVWPENKDLDISDWAIERLISRVRLKLHELHHKYKILTIHTRGYKLINKLI